MHSHSPPHRRARTAFAAVFIALLLSVPTFALTPLSGTASAATNSYTVTLTATNESCALGSSDRTAATASQYQPNWGAGGPGWSTSANPNIRRPILVFDTSSIPERAVITSASLELYVYDFCLSGQKPVIQALSHAPPYAANDYDLNRWSGSYGVWTLGDPKRNAWASWALQDCSIVTPGGKASIGLRMSNDIAGSPTYGYCYLDIHGSGNTNPPKLKVTYEVDSWRSSFTTNPVDSAIAGKPYTYSIGTNESAAYSLDVKPDWMTLEGNTLKGTPTVPGQYSVSIRAVSTVGLAPNWQNYSITVRQWAPAWLTTPSYKCIVGDEYSYAPTLNESATMELKEKPSWLTWDGASLRGTPSEAMIGSAYTVTLSATGPGGLASTQSWTITIYDRARWIPLVSSSPADRVEVARLYAYVVVANESVSISYSGPSWLSLSGMTLSGTAPSTPQTAHVSLKITSVAGTLAYWQNWTVEAWAEAPHIEPPPLIVVPPGESYQYAIGGSGWGEGGDRRLTLDNPPDWLDYDPINGTVTGTPPPGPGGNTIIVPGTVTNTTTGVSTPFEIPISIPAADPPGIGSGHQDPGTGTGGGTGTGTPTDTIWTDTLYSYVLIVSPERCTATMTTDAAWLRYDDGNRTIWGTPQVPGTHQVSLRIYDPATTLVSYDNWTIIVQAPPPVISGSASWTVLTNSSWSYVLVYSPADALLNISGLPYWMTYDNAAHTFAGTPHQAGTYTYLIVLTNATSGMEARQTVTVIVVDDAPVLVCNPPRTGQERVLYRWTASADQPVVWAISGDAQGWLTIDPKAGRVQGTPNAAGTYQITVTATNDRGISSSYSYTLTVSPYSSGSSGGSGGNGTVTLPGGMQIDIPGIGGTASYSTSIEGPVIAFVIIAAIVLFLLFRRRNE